MLPFRQKCINIIALFWFLSTTMSFAQETFRDNFSAPTYLNNNGSQNFSAGWVENGEGTNALSGRIRVNSNQLRFRNLDTRSISRTLDLSGASSATLTLDYNRTNGNERISVQLFNGASFVTVATLNGSGSVNFNLVPNQISSSSEIRFISGSGGWSNNETIFVDNVQISATFAPMISIDDVSVDEDAGTVTFTATHTGINAGGPFTVNYTTANGSATSPADYTSSTGTLNFNGISGDTDDIIVTIVDDFVFEGDETFSIQFTSSSDGSVDISDTATGTIVENESDPNATRPYEERDARNLQGNFLMRGNTNLLCTSNCPGTPVTNNPNVRMGYADVDADGTTINSSSSTINVPAFFVT